MRLPSQRHGFSNHVVDHYAVYAAISSISLSLIATGIDACFDFGSNLFLYLVHKRAEKMDVNKWPVGGARLETIGNIVYGESPKTLPTLVLTLVARFPVRYSHWIHTPWR